MTVLLLAALSIGKSGVAQTTVEFTYDNSGNRINRQVIVLKSARIASAGEDNQEQEVFEAMLDEREVQIYPNPTKGLLTIELGNLQQQDASIRVYSSGGQLTVQKPVTSYNQVNLSGCPPGFYILAISSGQEKKEWKIIKE